jgi:hypothetical protein
MGEQFVARPKKAILLSLRGSLFDLRKMAEKGSKMLK